MQNQILAKNLQGNVSQLEGRINNQILGVKGLKAITNISIKISKIKA